MYVVEGEYTVVVGNKSIRARAGTWIFVPRSVPHVAMRFFRRANPGTARARGL
ncbi:MAG: hypothetical protein DLM61_17965 [Pseudonocardiales bacterium]|nr:cupin domain-containing protein [Pseudonocardiales bacterium]PZS26680.1 MAG: hypothetical protein DLM61_17965 [Pseudonocardiales bacterium]